MEVVVLAVEIEKNCMTVGGRVLYLDWKPAHRSYFRSIDEGNIIIIILSGKAIFFFKLSYSYNNNTKQDMQRYDIKKYIIKIINQTFSDNVFEL